MSEFSQIRYEVADAVATLTLNRPNRGNAFTPIMRREMVEALDVADADDAVRAVVITGAGRHFCVGADLSGNNTATPFNYAGEGQQDEASQPGSISGVPRDGGGIVTLRLAEMRTPTIAAINGAAVGVGITMTLPMDIRVAATDARIGFVFARRGIMPEAASSWYLPRIVGMAQALEWVVTGRVFSAEEARAGRLVSQVVPTADVLTSAVAVAREIADNTSSTSIAAARHAMWTALGESTPWLAHERESLLMKDLKRGPDAAEGVASFMEKRPPAFRGRVSVDCPELAPLWPHRPDNLEITRDKEQHA